MELLIIGASARSAAHSALRAGIRPISIDLFADRDLSAIGPASRIESKSYPHDFDRLISDLPETPWMYTGALENAPELVDRLAARQPVLGISGSALRKVRDAALLSAEFTPRGLMPEVRDSPFGLPRDGSWLVKPLKSAGGRSIKPWIEDTSAPSSPSYYQRRVPGLDLAAIFVGSEQGATFLGVTKQILGRDPQPVAFDCSYVGSIGPWPVSRETRKEIEGIGSHLVSTFGLRGIFGVDGVMSLNGRFVIVEVNPRYSASVEVLELALGRSLIREHCRAFGRETPGSHRGRTNPPAFVGKRILFAERRSTLPDLDHWKPRSLGSFAIPHVADIPQLGTIFEPGDPVLTVLARGSTLELCSNRLHQRLECWRGRLRPVD